MVEESNENISLEVVEETTSPLVNSEPEPTPAPEPEPTPPPEPTPAPEPEPAPAPEPDPSLPGIGPSPWYGRLLDDINSGKFQQASIVCVALMVMNLLLVPLLINKYKEIKVKLKKRRKFNPDQIDDDLGEFFD